jgi:hypothetical protein
LRRARIVVERRGRVKESAAYRTQSAARSGQNVTGAKLRGDRQAAVEQILGLVSLAGVFNPRGDRGFMRAKRIRTACFGILLALVSIGGCAASRSDFVVALPNGYQIIRGKTSEPMIIKKGGHTIVPGPVASYTVVRDVVVGLVQAGDKTRYFVLNTRTGDVGKDLSESDYNERLKALNIPPSPELSPPVLPK